MQLEIQQVNKQTLKKEVEKHAKLEINLNYILNFDQWIIYFLL